MSMQLIDCKKFFILTKTYKSVNDTKKCSVKYIYVYNYDMVRGT